MIMAAMVAAFALWRFGDTGFGGDHQAGNRRRVLQGGANHLGWINDARYPQRIDLFRSQLELQIISQRQDCGIAAERVPERLFQISAGIVGAGTQQDKRPLSGAAGPVTRPLSFYFSGRFELAEIENIPFLNMPFLAIAERLLSQAQGPFCPLTGKQELGSKFPFARSGANSNDRLRRRQIVLDQFFQIAFVQRQSVTFDVLIVSKKPAAFSDHDEIERHLKILAVESVDFPDLGTCLWFGFAQFGRG
jgi:hypothetical protein